MTAESLTNRVEREKPLRITRFTEPEKGIGFAYLSLPGAEYNTPYDWCNLLQKADIFKMCLNRRQYRTAENIVHDLLNEEMSPSQRGEVAQKLEEFVGEREAMFKFNRDEEGQRRLQFIRDLISSLIKTKEATQA